MTGGVIAITPRMGESSERQQRAWKWIMDEVSEERGDKGWVLID